MVKKVTKKKVGRPALEFIYKEPSKVGFKDISFPMQVAFVFSWAMIAVLITVFIKSLL
jgi:hypothetical protein